MPNVCFLFSGGETMVLEYLLMFAVFFALSWVIFHEIKKIKKQKELWIDFTLLILSMAISIALFILTREKWILYLLIPEGVIFFSGLARDMKKIGIITSALVQLATFIYVYLFMNIGISSLKDPFMGRDIFLGFLAPLVFFDMDVCNN
jgi:hypothetical protein